MQERATLRKTKKLTNTKDIVIDAVLDKKAENVVSLDLRKIEEAITDYFIICHASTNTQIKAIAENVIHKVKEATGENPWHKEGFENLEWVLIDFVDVVVHVFKTETREFYQLEELWSDAVRQEHS